MEKSRTFDSIDVLKKNPVRSIRLYKGATTEELVEGYLTNSCRSSSETKFIKKHYFTFTLTRRYTFHSACKTSLHLRENKIV